MNRNVRSSLWFWALLVVMLAVGVSAAIAVGTHDSACATASSPKHWQLFPPRWVCERRY